MAPRAAAPARRVARADFNAGIERAAKVLDDEATHVDQRVALCERPPYGVRRAPATARVLRAEAEALRRTAAEIRRCKR